MKKKYICYQYTNCKNEFIRSYYCGYMMILMFGLSALYNENKEEAKKFSSINDLKKEIKSIGRKIKDYKIEEVC